VIDFLRFVSGMGADLVRHCVDLVAENALLRQQLIVAERNSPVVFGGLPGSAS